VKKLKSLSQKTGLSASEILRRAIDEYWERLRRKKKVNRNEGRWNPVNLNRPMGGKGGVKNMGVYTLNVVGESFRQVEIKRCQEGESLILKDNQRINMILTQ